MPRVRVGRPATYPPLSSPQVVDAATPLPRPVNNSKDGPLKTRRATRSRPTARMTSHHRAAVACVCAGLHGQRGAHRYRETETEVQIDSEQQRARMYRPRIHTLARRVHKERGGGGGGWLRGGQEYTHMNPPKQKPNTPVEAPSADEYMAVPCPLASSPLCHPSPHVPLAKVLPSPL